MFDKIREFINQYFGNLSDFGKKGKSVLGVDITTSSIKVVQLRKKRGKAILETYGEIALGPYSGTEPGRATKLTVEKTAEALRDLLTEAKVTTKSCGVSIPLNSSLIKVIEIPNIDKSKLKDIIPIEARKHIPVSISEVMLDWRIIPKNEVEIGMENGQNASVDNQVMLVAIHKDVINSYQEIISKVGLDTSFFEIEIFSTARSVLQRGIKPVLIFDFGVSDTKIYIVEHGIARVSHIVNRGSQSITVALSKSLGISFEEAEELKKTVGIEGSGESGAVGASAVVDQIFSEVDRMIRNYQTKYNKTISEIILAGGGSLLKGFHLMAKNKFKVETTMANSFQKVEAPEFLKDVLEKAGPEFSVAVGIALRKLEELN